MDLKRLQPVTLEQWFPKCAVRNSKGALKWKWAVGGAIGEPVDNCISVVLLTLSDQMHKKRE